MNTRLLTAFGLLPVLVFNATACRSVGGYSDLQAQVGSASQVKLEMYSNGGPVEVVPRSQGEQTATVEVGTYKVAMRRERDRVSYTTPASDDRLLVASGTLVETNLTLAELDGISPSKPLTWTHTMLLDRTDFGSKNGASTWKQHEGIVGVSTTWANVQRVTATEHGSSVLKGIGWVGAIGAYLAGAGVIAYELNNWKEKKTVNVPLIGVGGGLIVLGIPFLVLGIKNRSYKVSVYGEDKGSRVR